MNRIFHWKKIPCFGLPIIFILFLGIVFAFPALANASAFKAPKSSSSVPFTIYKDIAYKNPQESPRQKLDLYLPKYKKPIPLVIYIHGGGWNRGDKKIVDPWPFVLKGYAVASINYRLSPNNKYPDQLLDLKDAIGWLHKNAKRLNLNSKKFVAFGESAGGHLASMLAISDVDNGLSDTPPILAAIDFSGPKNLVTMKNQLKRYEQKSAYRPGGYVYQFLGGPIESKLGFARKVSPHYHLSKNIRPILLVHGDQDAVIPVEQSIAFAKTLKELGAPHMLIVRPGMGHQLRDRKSIDYAVKFLEFIFKSPV